MLRFLGFLIGSALVAVPAYVLWTPPFPAPTADEVGTAPSNAASALSPPLATPLTTTANEQPHSPLSATPTSQSSDTQQLPQDGDETPQASTTAMSEEPSVTPIAAVKPALFADPVAEADEAAEPVIATNAEADARQLHLFWSPFRSEHTAQGFAKRLTHVSGVDVRVAEAKPGRYRVGFDYFDEIHKNWYLGQIQARTGLDLGTPVQPTGMRHDETAQPAVAATAASGDIGTH